MKTYTPEKKQEAIDRFISGESAAAILADIGIPKSTFYNWVRIYQEEQAELNRKTVDIRNFHLLENKVARLETIIEILKSASCTPKSPLKQRLYNEDRHFGNFGLLRNNHTGEIIAPAPIFDNGLSLFNYAMPDDFKNLSAYAKTRSNPYRISYEDVCKEVMGAKQKAQLRRMVDFKFTRHPSLNLPEERLTAIEKQLGERTRELLSIPVQRSTKRKNEPAGSLQNAVSFPFKLQGRNGAGASDCR